jgi:hypothetical protein
MSDKPQEQTEQTPQGFTVPVPKRRDFFANLKKIAKFGATPGSSPPQPEQGSQRHR